MVCFSWDDGYASALTIAQMAQARGQRHTFGITTDLMGTGGKLTSAQVQQIYAMGHEIASHAQTHVAMSGQTAANRVLQYENSKAALEALIGAGNCKTWIYPIGGTARNATTDQELYLRYDRIVDVNQPQLPRRWDDGRKDFLIPRWFWNETTQRNTEVLAGIRRCATEPQILCLYGHDPDTASNPTLTQLTAAMDLAASLNIPCVSMAEAFPTSQLLYNPGFEESDATAPNHWIQNLSDGSQFCEVVADTPDVGINGTSSLHLKTVADTAYSYARQWVPVLPSTSYTLTARYRQTKASGAGGFTFRVQEFGYDPQVAFIAGNQSAVLTQTVWTRQNLVFTTRADTRHVAVDFLMNLATGEAWVDHADFRPTADGSFG